ncbi:MAG: DUF58 domain-containing protein [Thermococci archaeon]|nr:DUF58 domain-containing protein [Thermococci archaeon]
MGVIVTGVKRPLLISSLLLLVIKVFFYPFLPVYFVVSPALMFVLLTLLQAPDDVSASWEAERILTSRGSEVEVSLNVEVRRGVGVCSVSLVIPEELEVTEGNTDVRFLKLPWRKRVKLEFKLRPRRMGTYIVQSPEFISVGILMSELRTSHVGTPLKVVVIPESGGGRSSVSELRSLLVKIPTAPGAPVGPLSLDFKEIREYRSDPMKMINWKATARTGKLLVNEYEREGGREVLIYVDNRSGVIEEVAYMVSVLSAQLSRVGYSVNIYLVGNGRMLPPSVDQKTIYKLLLNHPYQKEGLRDALKKTMRILAGWSPTVIVVTGGTREHFPELEWFIKRLRALLPSSPPVLVDACMESIKTLENASMDRTLGVPAMVWDVYRESPVRVATMVGFRIGRRGRV